MMPGVVAAFPQAPIPTEIAVVEGGSSTDVYVQGYSDGSSGLGMFGTISPNNAAAIAGQITSTGNGRIRELLYSGDRAVANPYTVRLRIEGTYTQSTLPFTTLTISNAPTTSNTLLLNKSAATVTSGGGTTVVSWSQTGWNGMNKLVFA